MCGIAGIMRVFPAGLAVPPSDAAIPDSWLDLLDHSIAHRGPDGQGRFRDRARAADGSTVDVAFVHRRLSILDHAGGAQPMLAGTGPDLTALVFNGCIYNHRGLRAELAALGERFESDHSDTEVMLRGWKQWGTKVFDRLDGMYAAAWWDRGTASLTLSRDPFGEKPLFYLEQKLADGSLVRAFASTAAAAGRLLRVVSQRSLRPWVLSDWVRYGWMEAAPYDGVETLRRGACWGWTGGRDGEFRCRFFDAMNWAEGRGATVDTVDRALRSAVESRLDADVPLGVFLSGGIDSALVCHYAAQAREDLCAFTVRMPDRRMDESLAAAETARALGVRHEILDCTIDPVRDLQSIITEIGLPLGDSSLLPSMWVSRAARQVSKVALGGDGGDEIFMGYDRHRIIKWLWLAHKLPPPIRARLGELAGVFQGDSDPKSRRTRLARLLRAVGGNAYSELLAIYSPLLDPDGGVRLLHTFRWELFAESNSFADAVTYARFEDLDVLANDLLCKTDSASMHVGLELRSPFLARSVAQLGLGASMEQLMPRGERKGLLKAVARRYLPESIVSRPKQGFAIPIGEWLRTDFGGLRTFLMDSIAGTRSDVVHLPGARISRRYVDRMVAEHMERRVDHSQRLYLLMVLKIWQDTLK